MYNSEIMIQSQAQAIMLQLENDFPENEEEQANHAREYTVAYFNKDINELNWCASESYNLIKKRYNLKHWQYEWQEIFKMNGLLVILATLGIMIVVTIVIFTLEIKGEQATCITKKLTSSSLIICTYKDRVLFNEEINEQKR